MLNNEKFPIYQLDTNQSIITRIATVLKTIPKYLYFPDGYPNDLSSAVTSGIKVKDFLKKIKKDAEKSIEFKKFSDKNMEKITQLNMIKDVLYVWLAYNKPIEDLVKYNPIILQQIAEPMIPEFFLNYDDFDRFWNDRRQSVKRDLENNIKTEAVINTKYTDLYKVFDQIEDGLVFTDFTPERIMLDIFLKLEDVSLMEVFNSIILNENSPFVTCKNYYKILKDYVPPEEWAIPSSETDEILVKIYEKSSPLGVDFKHKDYTNVRIVPYEEGMKFSVKLITEHGYLSRDEFIARFFSIFGIPGELGRLGKTQETMKETEVVGIFYFPQERIDTYVFSDLVMNNKVFSSLINIDESTKATKKKSENSQPWLYIHFNHPNTGHITASIIQKNVDRSDPDMRDQDNEIFPHNSPYIRVRVKGQDFKSIEIFREMLSKLLVIYNNDYNEIIDFYKQFLPDFGQVEEILLPPKKKRPELIAPDVFVKNYSRNCNDARMPTIVSETHGKEVMVFPRDVGISGPTYPSDGKNQQNYVCLNPEYPFPGLQINKLGNSKQYPFVPCCFKTEQKDKKGGVYRQYFHGEQLEARDKKQHDLIITDKFLGVDKYGVLPPELQKLFEILDPDPTYRYIRVGVYRNNSSFLNSVMVALHEQTKILDMTDEEERNASILQLRSELADPNIAPLARQCIYDTPVQKIMENLSNTEEHYLDPKLYIQLLEGYFNCNIFIFNREKMVMPRYSQSYYKYARHAPCIFIYEHFGSESDHATYPQSELIVRWNVKKSDDTQFSFQYEQKIARNIRKIFNMLSEAYALDEKIQDVIFPTDSNPNLKIISQTIDSYGKTRRIDVEISGNKASMLTSPIPPLAVPENDSTVPILTSVKTAMKLAEDISSQTVSDGVCREINSVIGTVNVSIPVMSKIILPEIRTTTITHYIPTFVRESAIDTYNQNKKLARYLSEYIFWLFSRYLQENGLPQITDQVLSKFAKAKTVIVPDFSYKPVAKIFSLDGSVTQGGKLVVVSVEMLKRLMYVLKLYSIQDSKTLSEYYLRNSITHYYMDITDFDKYPNQVILQGDNAIDKWIQENKFVYTLHDEIMVGQNNPYFFKNNLVEKKVFLAQNVGDVEKAVEIATVWNRRGYNPGIHVDLEDRKGKIGFTLYSYINKDNIVAKRIGREIQDSIRILGYKLSGKSFFTVLLSLD